MFPELKNWVREVKERHIKVLGSVIEVGSRDVNGNVRDIFPSAIGIDKIEGCGVDVVGDAIKLLKERMTKVKLTPIDTFLCLETLEHEPRFWELLEQMRKSTTWRSLNYFCANCRNGVPCVSEGLLPVYRRRLPRSAL